MKEFCERIKHILLNNKKVFENYFFMTVLQILNSLFYLLIYPYLIRTLGFDSYGLYVFAWSIVTYFIMIVTFGFDMPAVKAIAENPTDKLLKEKVLSCVFTAKIYVELISICLFVIILISIPKLREHYILFLILFAQTVTNIIFPQWYYQGIQNMRTVTLIQLVFKLSSLPFIYFFVKSPNDVIAFATFMSLTSVLGGTTAMFMIRFKENLRIRWQSFSTLKIWYKDCLPFFLSNSAGVLKEQSIIQIIGIFFSMKDVAIYDLANKIILVPRTILMSVNAAIFPKIITNPQKSTIRKIIKSEFFIGIAVIVFVAAFGSFAVKILGGVEMIKAYPMSIILSITVLVWLVVGAYINFIFIPQKKYYYVTNNQIIALISFFVYAIIGLVFTKNVFVLAIAISLSGLTELFYCWLLARKNI